MIKKFFLVLVFGVLLSSCESDSDDGCGGALLSFKNSTTFSITLFINGTLEKTINPGQTHIISNPPRTVRYTATAGQNSWDTTITLDDCDARSINLTS